MLCDVCKCNDATVFLTQILEGKMQKVNLCDACSKEKGVQDPTGFALADLLLGIGAAEEIEKGAPTQKCPVCGLGEKGGAQFHPGIDQVPRGSASGNAGGICGKLARSVGARQAGSGGTSSD